MKRGNPKDIVGQRFGFLLVVSPTDERRSRHIKWLCRCECGKETFASSDALQSGEKRSCGHLRGGPQGRDHGMSRTPTWNSWYSMISRCTRPNDPSFYLYGARGISVCEQWKSFRAFLADMGERPINKTLDRINNDGGYEPGNCRWATAKEQASNKRPRGTVKPYKRRKGYRRRRRVNGVLQEIRAQGVVA